VGNSYLAFGDGGVDDAEDADVVLHEYAHALQDNAAPGMRYSADGETGAMREGFGDYWAFSARPKTKFDPACWAPWDQNDGTCERSLKTGKRYPDYKGKDAHVDGEIWSQGLRELHLKIGKQAADTIILKSHSLVDPFPSFAQGADKLIDADDM